MEMRRQLRLMLNEINCLLSRTRLLLVFLLFWWFLFVLFAGGGWLWGFYLFVWLGFLLVFFVCLVWFFLTFIYKIFKILLCIEDLVVLDINTVQKLFPTRLKVFRYNYTVIANNYWTFSDSFRKDRRRTLFLS